MLEIVKVLNDGAFNIAFLETPVKDCCVSKLSKHGVHLRKPVDHLEGVLGYVWTVNDSGVLFEVGEIRDCFPCFVDVMNPGLHELILYAIPHCIEAA